MSFQFSLKLTEDTSWCLSIQIIMIRSLKITIITMVITGRDNAYPSSNSHDVSNKIKEMQPQWTHCCQKLFFSFLPFPLLCFHLAAFHGTSTSLKESRKYRSKSRYERDLASAPASSELKMSLSRKLVSANEFSSNQQRFVAFFSVAKKEDARDI